LVIRHFFGFSGDSLTSGAVSGEAGSTQPVYMNDLPYDGGRFVVGSTGYDATIVGGQVIIQKGKLTGQRPGHVIRDFVRN
jgi:N-acyl-D-aspartate/D-glutamate deacylase